MLKIDPDNTNDHYSMILNLVNKYNIDGIIATNTSLSRPEILQDLNKKRGWIIWHSDKGFIR